MFFPHPTMYFGMRSNFLLVLQLGNEQQKTIYVFIAVYLSDSGSVLSNSIAFFMVL